MRTSLLFVAGLALSGCSMCKSDEPAGSKSSSAAEADGDSSSPTGPKRSAKIDLPARRPGDPAAGTGSAGAPPRLDHPIDIEARKQERRAEWMAKVDLDGDGQISDAERDAARQKRIDERNREMDTDGDGTVSDAERNAAREARTQEMHARLDGDGDGKVTAEEFNSSSFARLDLQNVDKDGNGDITVQELQNALRARNESRGFPRGIRMLRPGAGSGAAPMAPTK